MAAGGQPPERPLCLLQPAPGREVDRGLGGVEQQEAGEEGEHGAHGGDEVPGQHGAQAVGEDHAQAAGHPLEHGEGAAQLLAHHLHRVDRGGQQPVPRTHQQSGQGRIRYELL